MESNTERDLPDSFLDYYSLDDRATMATLGAVLLASTVGVLAAFL